MQPTNLEQDALDLENTEASLPHARKSSAWRRFSERLMPKFVRDAKDTFKESGFKGVLRRYGWKVVLGFFLYYLIRDSILYILIPYWIAKGIF